MSLKTSVLAIRKCRGGAIIDLRDLLAHGYEDVLLDRVWRVIEDDLRPLEAHVRSILDDVR